MQDLSDFKISPVICVKCIDGAVNWSVHGYYRLWSNRSDRSGFRRRTGLILVALCVTPRPRLYIHHFGVLAGSAQGPREGRFASPNSVVEFGHVHCWLFADVHPTGRLGDMDRTGPRLTDAITG